MVQCLPNGQELTHHADYLRYGICAESLASSDSSSAVARSGTNSLIGLYGYSIWKGVSHGQQTIRALRKGTVPKTRIHLANPPIFELEETVAVGTEAPQHADLFSLCCHHNPLEHVQHIFSFGERQANLLRLKLAIGTLELTDFERIRFIPVSSDLDANCDFHPNFRRP